MNDTPRRGRPPVDRSVMEGDRAPRDNYTNPYGITRENRRDLSTPNVKLRAKARQGFYRRWVNDTNGRVENFIEGMYTFVKASEAEGTNWSGDIRKDRETAERRRVGTNTDGSPMYAYLMEVPNDIHQEGKRRKEAALRALEAPITETPYGADRSVSAPNTADTQDGEAFYRPREGSHLRRESVAPQPTGD